MIKPTGQLPFGVLLVPHFRPTLLPYLG